MSSPPLDPPTHLPEAGFAAGPGQVGAAVPSAAAGPADTGRRGGEVLAWLVLGNLLSVLLVSLLALLVLQSSRDAFKRNALTAAQTLAQSMQQNIDAEIGRIDVSLQTLVLAHADLARQAVPSPQRLAKQLAEQRALLPMVEQLAAADAEGRAIGPSAGEATPTRGLGQRGFFVEARRASADKLIVSEPMFDAASQGWSLALARRLETAEGGFAGVVYAILEAEHFRQMFEAARTGPLGAISLRTITGLQLVARYSEQGDPSAGIGEANISAASRLALQSRPQGGTFVAQATLDQVERAVAYRQVGEHPLVVLVGIATDDYLRLWWRELWLVVGLAGLVTLVLASSSLLVHRAWQRDAASSRALARDVQARRQAEQALRREQALRSQVEAHARDLNGLLAERSDMLDVMAHEVRQPLNNASAALQGAAAALADVGESVAAARLKRAQLVMGQVLASIDNNLAVAALLVRSEPIERMDTDIDMLVDMAVADMPADERARIRIERQTATRTASMDLGLMRLALRNLLSNALKYSPPGTPVRVDLSDSDEPLALVIDVVDQGPGVDAALVPRLFDRGIRGSAPGKPAGHGLGLYIVRRVMELHHGRVELVSSDAGHTRMRLIIEQAPDD